MQVAMQMSSNVPVGYFPVGFFPTADSSAVKWVNFRGHALEEPFFFQTLQKLEQLQPPVETVETNLTSLIERASVLAPVLPSAMIFHVSRCGSTLLSNILKTSSATVGLSEARPIQQLLQRQVMNEFDIPVEHWVGMRRLLLDCVTTIFGRMQNHYDPRLIIKGNGVDMLQMSLARTVWPDVPVIVLTREPVEVLVSVIAKPAGWLKLRNKRGTAEQFGWMGRDLKSMSVIEYCARTLGRFCEAASEVVDEHSVVVDYSDLTLDMMYRLAEFVGVDLPSSDSESVIRIINTYSKDPKGIAQFSDDQGLKRERVTDEIRAACQQWADAPYRALRALSHRNHLAKGNATSQRVTQGIVPASPCTFRVDGLRHLRPSLSPGSFRWF